MMQAATVARRAAPSRPMPLPVAFDEDTLLLRRVAEGDRAALKQIYDRFQRPLVAYLSRFVRDMAVAEELAAEVMVGIWRQSARFEGRSSLDTWVFGIAHHKAVSWLRKRRDEEMPEGAAEALVDDAPTPETRANDRGLTDMMARLIARLPSEQQAVLQLSYFQEMPVEQVAEVIGCPVNTVKTRMYYARQHLKKMLAAEGVAVLPV